MRALARKEYRMAGIADTQKEIEKSLIESKQRFINILKGIDKFAAKAEKLEGYLNN